MNDSIIHGVANILFRNDLDDFVDGPRVPWGQKHYRGNNYAQCMQDDMPDGAIVWMAVVVYLHHLMADV
jgi:hypothetical protein